MSLEPISLLLQSSSGKLTIGLVQNGRILFDSCEHPSLLSSRNALDHLSLAGDFIDGLAKRIDRIYVDIGPGGLGATRSAVAFANAMAFARGIEVHGVHAFGLLGHEFQSEAGNPVICMRNAARPNYYLGIYEEGSLSQCSLTNKEEAISVIERYRKDASFAGRFSFGDEEVSSGFVAPVSEGNDASMSTFLSVVKSSSNPPEPMNRVFPITGKLEENFV